MRRRDPKQKRSARRTRELPLTRAAPAADRRTARQTATGRRRSQRQPEARRANRRTQAGLTVKHETEQRAREHAGHPQLYAAGRLRLDAPPALRGRRCAAQARRPQSPGRGASKRTTNTPRRDRSAPAALQPDHRRRLPHTAPVPARTARRGPSSSSWRRSSCSMCPPIQRRGLSDECRCSSYSLKRSLRSHAQAKTSSSGSSSRSAIALPCPRRCCLPSAQRAALARDLRGAAA